MARRKEGIEEKILDYIENGPLAAVELTLRLANARFKKRAGVLAVVTNRRGRPRKQEPTAEAPASA